MWLCEDIKISIFCSHLVTTFTSFQNIEIQGGGMGSVRNYCDVTLWVDLNSVDVVFEAQNSVCHTFHGCQITRHPCDFREIS